MNKNGKLSYASRTETVRHKTGVPKEWLEEPVYKYFQTEREYEQYMKHVQGTTAKNSYKPISTRH